MASDVPSRRPPSAAGRAGAATAGPELVVRDVAAGATHDLRRRVLRGGDRAADVHFPEDDRPEAFHLGAVDGRGRVVGVATWAAVPTERRPGWRAWRLRGMAVEPDLQGAGVGSLLLAAAVERLRGLGAEVAWADGRDTALAFYERHGWAVEGEGYRTATGIPHHAVVLELDAAPPVGRGASGAGAGVPPGAGQ